MHQFISRILEPARNSYLGLSEANQKHNMRTVRVNAQATAVTTILEFLGNFVNAIIFLLMDGFAEFTSLALFMQLYFVGLSYAFLMNTKYNKNRIIEYGWINIFKNIIYCGQDSSSSTVSQITQHTGLPSSIKKERYTKCSNYDISVISQNQTMDSEKQISIMPSNEIQRGININCQLDPQPCSSKHRDIESSTNSSYTNESTCYNTSIVRIRSQILSALLLHLHDEDNYIAFLVNLVELEGAYKDGKDVDDLEYFKDINIIRQLPHFIGTVERKFEMRFTMLENLNRYKKDNTKYEEYFEQFINMEESLLENGC